MPHNVENISIEINLFKAKWLLCEFCHPLHQENQYFFNNLGSTLDKYNLNYEKIYS